jgi:rod shape-determining protein MreD
MKVVLRVALVIFSAAVLYRGLFSQVRIAGVAVYLLLLVAIAAGIAGGPDRGAVVGFFSGIAMDLLLPDSPFGLSALTFCIVAYVVGRYERSVTRSARWVVMLTAGVASAAGMVLYIGLGQLLNQQNLLQRPFWLVLVVVSVANAFLAPLAVRILRWALDLNHRNMRVALR